MRLFLLLFLLFPVLSGAQSTQIDSVIIHTCFYNDDGDTGTVQIVDTILHRFSSTNQLVFYKSTSANILDGVLYPGVIQTDSLVYDSTLNTITTYSSRSTAGSWSKIETFDSLQRVISVDHFDSNFLLQRRYFYSYLPNNLIDYHFEIMFQNGLPVDSNYFAYSYDAALDKDEVIKLNWYNGSSYNPDSKVRYHYDNLHKLIAYNNYIWIDSTIGYDPCHLDTAHFTYNMDNLLTDTYYRYCGGGGSSSWYTYNQNGQIDSSGFSVYSSMGGMNSRACKVETYKLITTIHHILDFDTPNIYPVPADQVLTIDPGKIHDRILDVKVFDVSGRMLAQMKDELENSRLIHLNIGHLNSGVYFLFIFETNGIVKKKKFLKL